MTLPSFRAAFRRLFIVRLVGTVSLRFAYPFLPAIADGLDVSIGAVGLAWLPVRAPGCWRRSSAGASTALDADGA